MNIMLDALYDQLIKATLKQNHMLEEQLGIKQTNCDKLYHRTETPIDERILTTRWVKIPTFTRENKTSYYAIFLVDIPFWRKGELKTIYRQIIESIDSQDLDNHTIYLLGRLYGFFDKMNNQPKYYHIFRLNTDEFNVKERKLVLDSICNYLQSRLTKAKESMIKTDMVMKDVERLQYFVDTFRYMRVLYARTPNVSNTSHGHVVLETKTTTNTSHSNITRERGMEKL